MTSGCYCSIDGDGCLEDMFGIARECNCDNMGSFVEDSGILRNRLQIIETRYDIRDIADIETKIRNNL